MAKIVHIMNLDDPSLYIISDENIRLMIQAIDAFVRNDSKPATFRTSSFSRHARVLLNELHSYHVKPNHEQFPSFAPFFDTQIKQARIISYSITPLLIDTRCPFDLNERDKSEKCEMKTDMREKRLLLSAERYLSPVENASSNNRVMGGNEFKDIPQNRSPRNIRGRSVANEVEVMNRDSVEVVCPPKKRARKEISTIVTRQKQEVRESPLMSAINDSAAIPARQYLMQPQVS